MTHREYRFEVQPELQWALHHTPNEVVEHTCRCGKKFVGPVREIYEEYQEHVIEMSRSFDETERNLHDVEECGCCGGDHFTDFDGDCREDWERF